MRPYPDEIIQGIRWSLENAVIPDLSNDWPQEVAKNCLTLLAVLELRWRKEPQFLTEDTAEMRALFEETLSSFSRSPLASEERLTSLGSELQRTLNAQYSGEEESGPFAPLAAENEAFRETLIQLIDGIEEVAEDGKHASEFDKLRHEIHRFLRRQTNRDIQLALPGSMTLRPTYEKEERADDEA